MSELDELRAGFELRWAADMRAIKEWQRVTGRELTWPDHADLCVWLLGEIQRLGLRLAGIPECEQILREESNLLSLGRDNGEETT